MTLHPPKFNPDTHYWVQVGRSYLSVYLTSGMKWKVSGCNQEMEYRSFLERFKNNRIVSTVPPFG